MCMNDIYNAKFSCLWQLISSVDGTPEWRVPLQGAFVHLEKMLHVCKPIVCCFAANKLKFVN
jgi:hypothetical protein